MKYKVGDKVVLLKNNTYSYAKVGEEYYITKIDDSARPCSLGKEKGEYKMGMWVEEADIELVEDYTYGEVVEVSGDNLTWVKRIYLTTIKGTHKPYITVFTQDDELFRKGEKVRTKAYCYIRKEENKTEIEKAIELLTA